MFEVFVFTLVPEVFPGPLIASVLARAIENKLWNINVVDIRKYGIGVHKVIDDTTYGDGAGMLLRADIVADAIEDNIVDIESCGIFIPSPRGIIFNQATASKIVSKYKKIAFICCRFEGIDQRFIDYYNATELSMGDFVMTGGEIPCMAFIDTCIRLLDGVVGNKSSITEDSFGSLGSNYCNLLEYPHYTRPAEWRGLKVPPILLSGNHGAVEKWRLSEAKRLTSERRPGNTSGTKVNTKTSNTS